ncbi:hypothetical protein WJ970_16265 [Achromobacter xylosoxidans]
MGAAAIYVLDRTGYAVAASNWREPASFEGVDYQFRTYFRGAVAHGSAYASRSAPSATKPACTCRAASTRRTAACSAWWC